MDLKLRNRLASFVLPPSTSNWVTTLALLKELLKTWVHDVNHSRTIYPAEGETESTPETLRRVTLDSLPVEILENICSNLCMHCRVSHIVDVSPSDVACAHEEQHALSCLSRTSRIFRAVAQPMVFHYYHSRTHPDNDSDDCWEDLVETREMETLESFLRTILERPDLARSVKALAFYAFKASRTHDVPLEIQDLFRQAGKAAGFKDLPNYARVNSKWLQEAAIMMTPSLQELLLHRTSREGLPYLKYSPNQLPNLKYLVLPGRASLHDKSYHLQEMQDLLVKTQNLEVLLASDSDCGADIPTREWWRWEDWTAPLSNLRNFSLHGLDPENVAKVLKSCPKLEDFEYFCDIDKYSVLQPEHLEPLRPQLRRICYTGTTWENANGTSQEVIDHVTGCMKWDTSLRADFNFGHFQNLEVLEVEQMLLYGPVFSKDERAVRFEALKETGPEMFMSTLPWSLQVLHIGMVLAWPEMYRDLLGMTEKIYRFKDLKTVVVDPYECPPEDEVQKLTETFAQYGIEFQVGQTTQIPFSRGMMGVRPGHSEPAHSAGLTFPLEELE